MYVTDLNEGVISKTYTKLLENFKIEKRLLCDSSSISRNLSLRIDECLLVTGVEEEFNSKHKDLVHVLDIRMI